MFGNKGFIYPQPPEGDFLAIPFSIQGGCLKSLFNAKAQRFFAKFAKNKSFKTRTLRSSRKSFAHFAFKISVF